MINLRSKLLNLSEIARRLNMSPGHLHNKVYGVGRAKPLAAKELIEIELLIKKDIESI